MIFPSYMSPTTQLRDTFYLIVAAVPIGLQITGKSLEEFARIFAASSRLVIVQDDVRTDPAGATQPQIRLRLRCTP